MGVILLFPKPWRNSSEVEEHLNKLQELYMETHASIMVDCRFDEYQYIIRSQQLANHMRSKLKVIEGGLKDEPLDKTVIL